MIDFNVMEVKLKNKQAEVIRVNERMSKGKYVKTVKYNDETYKLCPEPDCLFYKTLDNFTKTNNGYHTKCKKCRSTEGKDLYRNNLERHIYTRWKAINRRLKPGHQCTFEDFSTFFKTAKCPYTGKTPLEEFNDPHPNVNLRVEIDHIVAVAEGGSSKIENLQVIPKVINSIKRNSTPAQFRETLNFLAQFSGAKR